MLLSEFVKTESASGNIFSLDCDIETTEIPSGDYNVYLNLDMDTEGVEPKDEVLDAIIEFTSANKQVTLCIPFDSLVSSKQALSLSKNASFDLALMPPSEFSEESFQAYKELLCAYLEQMLANPAYSRHVTPVSGYIEYLFKEALSPEEMSGFEPDDEFVVNYFFKVIPVEFADRFKAELKSILVNYVYDFMAPKDKDLSKELVFMTYVNQLITNKIQQTSLKELKSYNKELSALVSE